MEDFHDKYIQDFLPDPLKHDFLPDPLKHETDKFR